MEIFTAQDNKIIRYEDGMEQTITKNGDVVTIATITKEVYDISALKEELLLLENEHQPTNKELIEAGKTGIQPFYYSPQRQFRIDWLKEKIKELENYG